MFFRTASFYFFSGWVESIVAAVHIETAQKYFHLFSDFTKYTIIIDRGSSVDLQSMSSLMLVFLAVIWLTILICSPVAVRAADEVF